MTTTMKVSHKMETLLSQVGRLLWNMEGPQNLIPYDFMSPKMFHILLTKMLKQPKNYPFHKVFQINLVESLYFIQTSMPGLLNSSRSGSSYVRWVAAQQPTRRVGARLRNDLRVQNRNLQQNLWNAEESIARLLLTCTF
jgi:hypothetical protein